jgi:hypothetical protein
VLLALILSTSAHADLDDWTKQHMRQFEAKWVTIQKKFANFARNAKFINMILAYYLLTVLCGDGSP